jgi:hypothetical protein
LTRTETRARSPVRAATRWISSSSGTDSRLKHNTSARSACSISASLLPTPENTVLRGSPPAASTRASSPPDTMSKPAPARASRFSTARFEFAFIA